MPRLRILRVSANRVGSVPGGMFPNVRTLYADNNLLGPLVKAGRLGKLENLSLRNQGGKGGLYVVLSFVVSTPFPSPPHSFPFPRSINCAGIAVSPPCRAIFHAGASTKLLARARFELTFSWICAIWRWAPRTALCMDADVCLYRGLAIRDVRDVKRLYLSGT